MRKKITKKKKKKKKTLFWFLTLVIENGRTGLPPAVRVFGRQVVRPCGFRGVAEVDDPIVLPKNNVVGSSPPRDRDGRVLVVLVHVAAAAAAILEAIGIAPLRMQGPHNLMLGTHGAPDRSDGVGQRIHSLAKGLDRLLATPQRGRGRSAGGKGGRGVCRVIFVLGFLFCLDFFVCVFLFVLQYFG
jgi:hypothetical protein